ncbi:MAG: GDSL-type esterase/lipase family protein [Polyangiaceae bacterium]
MLVSSSVLARSRILRIAVLGAIMAVVSSATARRPKSGKKGGTTHQSGGKGKTSSLKFTHVVTLGDSFASGTGIHRSPGAYDDHGPANHWWSKKRLGARTCYRETDWTPGSMYAKSIGATNVFLACRGALAEDEEGQRHVLNQLAGATLPLDGANTLIVLSVGGNDLRTPSQPGTSAPPWRKKADWPDTLASCILEKDCHENKYHQISNFSAVQSSLSETYRSIAKKYPKATIRVLSYPRLMQPRKQTACPVYVTGINHKEAQWIDAQVDRLNQHIGKAVSDVGGSVDIRQVLVADEFDGHGACSPSGNRFINDRVNGNVLDRRLQGSSVVEFEQLGPAGAAFSSFHPTPAGYDAYLRALKKTL